MNDHQPIFDFQFIDNERFRQCYDCKELLPMSRFGRETSSTVRGLHKTACKACLKKNNKSGREAKKVLGLRPPLNHQCVCKKIYLGDDPNDPQARRIFVPDHDHQTGLARGWLCRECNTGLGKIRDDTNTLVAMIAYLVQHGAPFDNETAMSTISKARQKYLNNLNSSGI
jgi:hypothetical protein